MKLSLTLLAAAIALSASPAQAGIPAGFGAFRGFETLGRRVHTRGEAEKLPAGTKIALMCRECRMLDVHDVSQKERVLAWFVPQVEHKCAGCGGKMTLKTSAAAKKNAQYTHVCTKCGNNSTFVCVRTPEGKH